MTDLRDLPSVDQLINTDTVNELIKCYGRPLTIDAIRITLNDIRFEFKKNQQIPSHDIILNRIRGLLAKWTTATLLPVINATGVILHTNLGRAPLSHAALEAIHQVSSCYSNLEFDLKTGRRGSRSIHAEQLLVQLTGAEAALVVNNNAAAVMLVLSALARRRRVVIARSQLVEIGGGFRVPDVMKQSGAILVEVGTTNRVHLSDFETTISEQPIALLLRAHRSNFKIVGFTSEPSLREMASLAHNTNIPLVDDLGSGSLVNTKIFGLSHEPMVQESIVDGADIVCFSGDKLLGGPQAGIIVGKKEIINKLKKHPLARAIRADKVCLTALSATLLHYLKDEATEKIPIWRMIATPLDIIHQRANQWVTQLGYGDLTEGLSTVGGGSLPGETLPTTLVSFKVPSPQRFLSQMRKASYPIIGRIQDDCVVLDPRTVLPEQEEFLLKIMTNIIKDYP
jgi:L-seryl-tRNA(Ser) seleniumtransferase